MVKVLLLFALVLLLSPIASARPQTGGSPPLRVAVAGLVHGHADGFLRTYLHRADVQIVGIAEPRRELFDRYAREFQLDPGLYHAELEELVTATRPQAVLAYTTTADHRRVVEVAARHGVAVMMEKPLATGVEDAQAIERAARAAKITVLVNYETTWYPSNRAAFDLVSDGSLGGVRKVVIHDGHEGPKEIGVGPEFLDWLRDPAKNGGGALFDFGCYGADLMTALMKNQRPLTVTAVTQRIKPEIYPLVDDEATIVLTYPQAQAIVQASWNWPFSRKDLEVYGATGYAITVGRDGLRLRRPHEAEEKTVTAAPLARPYDDPIVYLRAVLDGLRPEGLSSLETNMVVTEILDAARRSAASGKTIRLDK